MEDILDVYQRPHDPECPMVCMDETSKQLIAETRVPIAAKPGRAARYDYEYRRNGTANLFMMFAPLEGWRHVKVTDRHTALDYAQVLKELSDTHFSNAKKIVLIQDNLNTHKPASLYEAFPPAWTCPCLVESHCPLVSFVFEIYWAFVTKSRMPAHGIIEPVDISGDGIFGLKA